jgi:hypothetical protein
MITWVGWVRGGLAARGIQHSWFGIRGWGLAGRCWSCEREPGESWARVRECAGNARIACEFWGRIWWRGLT